MRSTAKRTFQAPLTSFPRFNPMMSLEEAWMIETASRMKGQSTVEFMREAGLARALTILDESSGTSETGGTSPRRKR